MFINESVENKNTYLSEATAEASYMYEAILEANETYHNLCMKMVKCEHTCIVNEDAQMLTLAEAEFIEKAKATAKQLWEKFKAFCSKMYDTMLSGLAKAAKLLAVAKKENGTGKKVKLAANMSDYYTFVSDAENMMKALITGNVVFGAGRTAANVINGEKGSVEVDASQAFEHAKKYIEKFKPAVQQIKALRTAQLNSKNEENVEAVSAAVSQCTKAINRLRAGLMDALKVIYACSMGAKAVDKTVEGTKSAAKATVGAAKKAGNAVKGAFVKKESVSVLDQF